MQVQPYLFFDGRCDEAIEFYKVALQAEVEFMMRFKDHPEPQNSNASPESDNKVMHATMRVGETRVMVSDGRNTGMPHFEGFSLALDAHSISEAERLFAALSDGGKIQMPLTKTFFSPMFGMIQDKFGVPWMIITRMPQ